MQTQRQCLMPRGCIEGSLLKFFIIIAITNTPAEAATGLQTKGRTNSRTFKPLKESRLGGNYCYERKFLSQHTMMSS